MSLPLASAPRNNHGLSITEWCWNPNTLASLAKAMELAVPSSSPSSRPAYHPTLWARAQESWDLLQTLEISDGVLSDPSFGEWLALLWGLCTRQFRSAYLTASQDSALLLLDDGQEPTEVKRELHFVLKATRSPSMAAEPILLFYFEHEGRRVWVGGYDPRCLVFAANLSSQDTDTLVEKGLADRQGAHRRLRLDLDDTLVNKPEYLVGFLGYLEEVARHNAIQERMKEQLRNLVLVLRNRYSKQLQHIPRPGSQESAFDRVPGFPGDTLASALLRTLAVRVQIDAPTYYPHLKLLTRDHSQGTWIRSKDPELQANQIFTFDDQGNRNWGSKISEAGSGSQQAFGWVDPVLAFVAPQAFLFEDSAASADYLPLRPEVLKFYTPKQIREGFRLLRSQDSCLLRIELPTLAPGRPFRKDIVFSAQEDSPHRLVRFSPADAPELRPLALAIWPNFRHSAWNDYLMQQKLVCPGMHVTFHRQDASDGFPPPRVPLDARPTLFPIPGVGAPDFIELTHEGRNYGGFFPRFRELPAQVSLYKLVMDLGSTNTTIAIRHTLNDDASLFDFNLQGSFLDLIGHATSAQLADLPYQDVLGLSPDAAGEPIQVLPTTPMVSDASEKYLENHFPTLRRQGLDYPKRYFKHTRLKGTSEWHYLPGIKFNQAQDVQKAYVRSLLTLVRGQLSSQAGALVSWENLVLTYPLSMQSGQGYARSLFKADPQADQDGLCNYSICSESWANFQFVDTNDSLKNRHAQFDGGYLLIMDMGGGTTDFSVVNNWKVVCGDSLGPRGRGSGFNEPFGGNILVPILEKSINHLGPCPTDPDLWSLSRLLAHVANEVKLSPQTPLRDLLEFSLQGRITALTAEESTDFQVRLAVLAYLIFYYGAAQILSHAVCPREGKERSGEKGVTAIDVIQLYMPGAGWKIMRLVYPSGAWEVPLFNCAFEAARKSYCQETPFGPRVLAPFENEAVPKASVALGAANTNEGYPISEIPTPAGISLKGEPWFAPWDPRDSVPSQADFSPDLVPDPFHWIQDLGTSRANLESIFPRLDSLQAYFLQAPHLQAIREAHRDGLTTIRQEIARLGRSQDGQRGNRTPFDMYLEGFYRSYFQRPLKIGDAQELPPPMRSQAAEAAVPRRPRTPDPVGAVQAEKPAGAGDAYYVAMGWEDLGDGPQMDLSVFMLNKAGRLPSTEFLVYHGSPLSGSPDGSVKRLDSPREATDRKAYLIRTADIPAEISELIFAVSLRGANSGSGLGSFQRKFIRIVDSIGGGEVVKEQLEDKPSRRAAAEIAKLYRDESNPADWNFTIINTELDGGFRALTLKYQPE